jgi:hypothetical protein
MKNAKRLLESRRELLRKTAFLTLGGVAMLAVTCQGAHAVLDPTPTPVQQRYTAIDGHYTLGSVRSAVPESDSTYGRRKVEAQRVERPQSAADESEAPRQLGGRK